MKKIILVKLGGSLITDKSKAFSEDLGTIKRLAREIHQAGQQTKIELIVGHGGGSYPHIPAQKYRTDEKQGCCILSTEMILNFLALRLQEKGFKILRIIHCGKTDGVRDAQGKTIFQITPKNFTMIKKSLGASNGIDVTGGMLHKVEECLRITRLGIPSQIINGLIVNNLKKAILGRKVKGTLINAEKKS